MIQVAVTTNLECAHYSDCGVLHGHSYVIKVWFPAGEDLPVLDSRVKAFAAGLDHTLLAERMKRMEDIAGCFLAALPDACRVIVRRPTLGYVVEAMR